MPEKSGMAFACAQTDDGGVETGITPKRIAMKRKFRRRTFMLASRRPACALMAIAF
jgi:hypothetical protein